MSSQGEVYHFSSVPLFMTSVVVDMAMHLAAMLRVEPEHRSSLVQLLVLMARFRRHADDSVDYLLLQRGIAARPRFMALDYAAGAVAAAVRYSTSARTATAVRLVKLTGASPDLVKGIRDALLCEFATEVPPRSQPFTLDELVQSRAREESAAAALRRSRSRKPQPPPQPQPEDAASASAAASTAATAGSRSLRCSRSWKSQPPPPPQPEAAASAAAAASTAATTRIRIFRRSRDWKPQPPPPPQPEAAASAAAAATAGSRSLRAEPLPRANQNKIASEESPPA